MPNPDNGGGFAASFRRSGESILALVLNRLQLISVELRQEKLRLTEVLILFAAALASGLAGSMVLTGALAYWMWKLAGSWGVACVAAAAFALSGGLVWFLRRRIIDSTPFAGTIAEFRKDMGLSREGE